MRLRYATLKVKPNFEETGPFDAVASPREKRGDKASAGFTLIAFMMGRAPRMWKARTKSTKMRKTTHRLMGFCEMEKPKAFKTLMQTLRG